MDFLGTGPLELLIILLVGLLVLGPVRVVQMARSTGKVVREIQRVAGSLTSALDDVDPPPPGKSNGGQAMDTGEEENPAEKR